VPNPSIGGNEMIGAKIKVTDNGIGISEEDKLYLFKPFFKTKDKKSFEMNKESHGLGLSICKRIAKGLGGDLILNEELSKGCEFIMTLIL